MAELTYDPTPADQPEFTAEEQESIARGEAAIAEQEAQYAGKFKDAQELEKAYLELQSKMGSQEKSEEPEQATEEPAEESADNAVDLLWKVNDEYEKNDGKVSEETLEELGKMSSRDLAEAFFRFQDTVEKSETPKGVELSDSEIQSVQDFVGGTDKYQELVSWAGENFSEEEITAFDSVVETGNIPAIKLALQALQYRYQDNMGVEGNMIQGKPAASREIFRSQAELVRAMSDPRYDQDPAYRMEIMEKLERSGLEF